MIGIPEYPALSGQQLRGVKNDVDRMSGFLQGAGFQVTALYGEKATSEEILAALASLENAGSGDDIAVYFSGRGGLTGSVRDSMEPTLAPYDALADKPDKDIPISRLEKLAQKIDDAGGSFLLILDCSYQRPPMGSKDLYNHYDKENIRTMGRSGRARKKLFDGPGVVIAACGSQGGAYEWRVMLDAEKGEIWYGAFTHSLCGMLSEYVFASKGASYRDLMNDVAAPILEREAGGYMPGFIPFPSGEALASLDNYAKPVVILAKPSDTGSPPPPHVEQAKEEKAKLESDLRVGFEVDDTIKGKDRDALIAKLEKETGPALESAVPGLKVAARFSAKPDRVVILGKAPGGGYQARVPGEPVDDPAVKPVFKGKSLAEIASGGLKDFLETAAAVFELQRMAEGQKGSDFRLRMDPDKRAFAPTDDVRLGIRSNKRGLIYLIDVNQSDGIVHLIAAGMEHPNDPRRATADRFPSNVRMQFTGPQKSGRIVIWCLLAVPGDGVALPKVEGGDPSSPNLLAHLRAARGSLKSGKMRWRASRVEIQIVK